MNAFISRLLETSLIMSAAILLFAALSRGLRNKTSPRLRFWGWMVIAAGLLIPYRPMPIRVEIPLAAWAENAARAPAYETPGQDGGVIDGEDGQAVQSKFDLRALWRFLDWEDASRLEFYDGAAGQLSMESEQEPGAEGLDGAAGLDGADDLADLGVEAAALPAFGQLTLGQLEQIYGQLAHAARRHIPFVIWAAGACICLLVFVIRHCRFVHTIKRYNRPAGDERITQMTEQIKEWLGIRRRITIYVNSRLTSPVLLGFFRPVIALPWDCMSDPEKTRLMLLHEVIHLKRGDPVTMLLSFMALAVHWFNPLAYVMRRAAAAEAELACDAAVIKCAGESARMLYGETILYSAKKGVQAAGVLSPALTGGGRQLKQRLRNIIENVNPKKWKIIYSTALSLLCLGLIVLSVFIVINSGDKDGGDTPGAAQSNAPAASAPDGVTPGTVTANTETPAGAAGYPAAAETGPFYYAESASLIGGPGLIFNRPCTITADNQIIFTKFGRGGINEREIEPGVFVDENLLYITDGETERRFGPIAGSYRYGYDENGDYEYLPSAAMQGFTVDGDYNLYVIYWDPSDDSYSLSIYDRDFNLVKADIPWDEDENPRMYSNVTYYNGVIYTQNAVHTTVQARTTDGVRLPDVGDYTGVYGMDISPDGFLYTIYYARNSGTCYIGKFDLNTGERVYDNRVTGKLPTSPDKICFNPYDGYIYTMNYEAIYRYDADQNVFEPVIVFGEDTRFFVNSIHAGEYYMEGFECGSDGSLFFIGRGDPSGIYKFSRFEGVKPNRDDLVQTRLTLTAAYREEFIEDALKRFGANYPEIKIDYQPLYETLDEFYADPDTQLKLRAQIMANDIGDIVNMPSTLGTPLATDVFIDLWDRVKNDESWPILNQDVLRAFRFGGDRLTGLPMGFACESMVYNKTLGDSLGISFDYRTLTWSGILELARGANLTDAYLYGYVSDEYDSLMVNAALQNLRDLVDADAKTVNLKQDWFIQLMRAVKEAQDGGLTKIDGMFNNRRPADCLFTYNAIYGVSAQQVFVMENGDDFINIPMPRGELNRNSIGHPMYVMCISERSQYPDEAWKFLSFLLNDNTQALFTFDAIPLNNKTVERTFDMFWYGESAETIGRYTEIFNNIDVLGASRYQRALLTNLEEYMYGDSTLEAALDKAEYDIWLLLNE